MSIHRPRVGFVTALEMEGRWLGDSDDSEVVVCGMGRVRAESAAWRLVDLGIDGLVSWGVAGGLDPVLEPGTVMLVDQVIQPNGPAMSSDADWRGRLELKISDRVRIATGSLFTADEVLSSVDEKRAVRKRWGAGVVDMETAAIATVAQEARLPWLAVRVVTDTAAVSLPPAVTASCGTDGRLRPGGVAKLVLSPWLWPDLFRLAGTTRAAARAMRELRSAAGPDLGLASRSGADVLSEESVHA